MHFALCAALCAIGHMIRDGFPSFQELEAPLIGTPWEWWYHLKRMQYLSVAGLVCLLGAIFVQPEVQAEWLALAVFVGFFTDSRHAAGQGPDDTWAHTMLNAPNLVCSGVTSLVPVAVASGLLTHSWSAGYLLLLGLIKPVLWIASWNTPLYRLWSFLVPTRVAAMLFGALAVGGALTLAG